MPNLHAGFNISYSQKFNTGLHFCSLLAMWQKYVTFPKNIRSLVNLLQKKCSFQNLGRVKETSSTKYLLQGDIPVFNDVVQEAYSIT